jgi:hypothetical protein
MATPAACSSGVATATAAVMLLASVGANEPGTTVYRAVTVISVHSFYCHTSQAAVRREQTLPQISGCLASNLRSDPELLPVAAAVWCGGLVANASAQEL